MWETMNLQARKILQNISLVEVLLFAIFVAQVATTALLGTLLDATRKSHK